MAQLTTGIRVALDTALIESGEPRLLLNDGTREVINSHAKGIPYNSRAFVPRSEWHAATESERRLLVADEVDSADPASTIWIFRLSDAFMAPLEPYRKSFGASRDGCEAVCDTRECLDAQRHAVSELALNLRSAERIRVLGTCVNEPGLMTTTRYTEDGVRRFSGLHVDDWERGALMRALQVFDSVPAGRESAAPTETRAQSWNKISINIGWEDRYFLFINRAVADLMANGSSPEEPNRVGHAFMQRCPDYPVVRARIRPGEGYIAPTGNIVHDGSTEGMNLADVTINLLCRACTVAKDGRRN